MGRPPKSQDEIDASNQYASFMKGWVDGARVTATHTLFTEHTSQLIRDAYNAGYTAGRAARNKAAEDASRTYGYTPSVLRLQS